MASEGEWLIMTKENILRYIDDFFGDTTVSAETTLEALEEIQGVLSMRIDALREDLHRQKTTEPDE